MVRKEQTNAIRSKMHRTATVALLPLLLSLCLLPGCGAVSARDEAEFGQAAAAEIARRPQDYQNGEARAFLVGRAGRAPGLLWGTVHIRYDDATMLPRAIRERFAASRDLTVEHVADRVSDERRRRMEEETRRALQSVDETALASMDPPTRQVLLDAGLTASARDRLSLLGFSARLRWVPSLPASVGDLPEFGFVDLLLIAFARGIDMPVRGLEQPEPEVRRLIADPNGTDRTGELRLLARRQDRVAQFGRWFEATYGRGDSGRAVAALYGWRADADDHARFDRERDASLTRRNESWIPRLDATLAEPGFHFVAFGASHLLGKDGIVALLRRQGWQVLPCPGDRCPALLPASPPYPSS